MKTSTLLTGTATAVFVIAGTLGAALWAHDSAAQGPFGPAMHGAPHDGSHLNQMAAHIKAVAIATPEQGAQIDALVAQATTEVKALHAQGGQLHAQLHAALAQDRIDRAALENLRLEHIRVLDQGSKRLVQLMADVAEVLTPEQRRTVVARMESMHGAH